MMDRLDKYFLDTNEGSIYEKVIDDIERILIEKALERSCGNQITAAKMLGLNRNTLHSKIKRLHIDPELFKR
jgi:DNA-binding protein Fis